MWRRVGWRILARWYQARAIRARSNCLRLMGKAEKFFHKLDGGEQ